jgi:hypothetical protein
MFAQSLIAETPDQSAVRGYTYTGNIVNANCYQAAAILNRNSRGYVPLVTASAFNRQSRSLVPNASPAKKKQILRHCSINPGTTEFALLNDDGNFFKLDERGNLTIMSQIPARKASPRSGSTKIRAVVTGSVDGETLVVKSVSKL